MAPALRSVFDKVLLASAARPAGTATTWFGFAAVSGVGAGVVGPRDTVVPKGFFVSLAFIDLVEADEVAEETFWAFLGRLC